jgi:catechol 2,3-dioxygenase-like lactoylglutathione lyase family enzyme
MRVREVLETCLYARDLEAAERFYANVLGLEAFSRAPGRHVFFRCGHRVFLVFDPDATRDGGDLPGHGAEGPVHVCFAVGQDEIDAWKEHLQGSGVEIEAETTWPGGGRSLYFRDPAGNCLELAPPGIWRIPEAEAFGVTP